MTASRDPYRDERELIKWLLERGASRVRLSDTETEVWFTPRQPEIPDEPSDPEERAKRAALTRYWSA